jgi:hypothetical protein
MRSSDGVREGVRRHSHPRRRSMASVATSAQPLPLRPAGLCSARLICALGLLLLAGCGTSASSFLVDPGRYSVYHCKELAARAKELAKREQDLRELMGKASEGGGGTVIGAMAYRTDYETVLGEEKLVQRMAVEKKCDFIAAPASESDQIIR